MTAGSLARRYARALLDLAKTPVQRDKFAKDCTSLLELLRQKDESGAPVLQILSSNRFRLADRKSLLGALAKRAMVDPLVLKFFEYVVQMGRGPAIPDIVRAYVRLSDDAAHRVQAEVCSASPLAPDVVIRIKHELENATGKTVVMTTRVDPELIGGVVTRVGSYVLDGSVRSTLARMRNELRT